MSGDVEVKRVRPSALSWLRDAMPRVGQAGSRSATLHSDAEPVPRLERNFRELNRFAAQRWLGTLGAILIMVGGIGAGATPVIGNAFWGTWIGTVLGQMLQASTIVTFTGIGLLVIAWLGVGAFVYSGARSKVSTVDVPLLKRTYLSWMIPLVFTAPLFTQDIYSYLAQGAIVVRGMDPYSAGPVDLLGATDSLARSVPLIWSHDPSPYGPVAMMVAAAISVITSDHVLISVFLHRLVSVTSLIVVGWALVRLAKRCGVSPQFALWLGVLNPLVLLHLVGGIHNESLLLALLLVGFELCLLALHGPPQSSKRDSMVEPGRPVLDRKGWALFAAGVLLISMAGLVKVTGFVALGFVGMQLARRFGHRFINVITAAMITGAIMAISVTAMSLLSGLGFGWITSQGGAAAVRSWMSLPTSLGTLSGFIGRMLGIGDISESALTLTRAVGIAIAIGWLIRMLWATYRGRVHPLGGYGLSTLVLVLLFPVVHPWYLLWALVPLAAWANRQSFRLVAVIYSVIFSFTVLPRGMGLPPGTVLQIYLGSAASFIIVLVLIAVVMNRKGLLRIR